MISIGETGDVLQEVSKNGVSRLRREYRILDQNEKRSARKNIEGTFLFDKCDYILVNFFGMLTLHSHFYTERNCRLVDKQLSILAFPSELMLKSENDH